MSVFLTAVQNGNFFIEISALFGKHGGFDG
jgi:hypothetical protein